MRGGEDPIIADQASTAELRARGLRRGRPDHGGLPRIVGNESELAADDARFWRIEAQVSKSREGLERRVANGFASRRESGRLIDRPAGRLAISGRRKAKERNQRNTCATWVSWVPLSVEGKIALSKTVVQGACTPTAPVTYCARLLWLATLTSPPSVSAGVDLRRASDQPRSLARSRRQLGATSHEDSVRQCQGVPRRLRATTSVEGSCPTFAARARRASCSRLTQAGQGRWRRVRSSLARGRARRS